MASTAATAPSAMEAICGGKTIQEIASDHEINQIQMNRW